MYLIEKGKKPREFCRECVAFHAQKDCPVSEERQWKLAQKAGERFYRWAMAYQEEIRRNG